MTDPLKLAEEIENRGEMLGFLGDPRDPTECFTSPQRRLLAAALRLAETCQVIVSDEGIDWRDFDSEPFAAYRKAREA